MQSSLSLIKNEFFFQVKRYFKKEPFNYDNQVQNIVKKIEKEGFAVFPNFYNTNECENLRNEIDTLIAQRENDSNLWSDSVCSDKRCHSAEEDSALIALFFNNDFLVTVASNYAKLKMECSNTLASRIKYKKGNIGSGQGWHRDSNNFQFKAMVYLSDVGENDGGMQYASVNDNVLIREYTNPPGNHSLEQQIAGASSIEGFKIESMTGKKGTFFIFDNCIYHRASHTADKNRDALLLQVAPA